jgi:CubicO group peptidase (beta-lactamase class C family)
MRVAGTCAPEFELVRSALGNLIESGDDVGASAAVVLRGELVADVWGGHVDAARTQPWTHDTIVNVFSTTKTMTNLCALILADRGEIDLDAPVAHYWPDFGTHGKQAVLVRHVLAHTAGLPGWDTQLKSEDLYDWDRCTSLLAAQAPWWQPGTRSGYHVVTQGNLVGEIVRRVTDQTLGEFFNRHVAVPLGADFHIGTPAEMDTRIAELIPPPDLENFGDDLVFDDDNARDFARRALRNPPPPSNSFPANTTEWRRAEIPAANGHGNARSVATIQALVSHLGETAGIRVLSEKTCRQIFREQANGPDLILGAPLRFGIGYGLSNETVPLPNPDCCYWGGWGGSLVVNDLETGMTVAYVMNRMGTSTIGDERGGQIVEAAYASCASV